MKPIDILYRLQARRQNFPTLLYRQNLNEYYRAQIVENNGDLHPGETAEKLADIVQLTQDIYWYVDDVLRYAWLLQKELRSRGIAPLENNEELEILEHIFAE